MKNITLSPELPVLSLVTFEPTSKAVTSGKWQVARECALPSTSAAPTTLSNFFEKSSRRSKLVRATRHAFVAWNQAADTLNARQTALRPSDACIQEAALLTAHRKARYMALETALATETGLNEFSVFNDIAGNWPLCSRLLRAGL